MLKDERVQYLLVPPGRIAARRSTKLKPPGLHAERTSLATACFTLSDVRSPALSIVCEPCGRRGRYSVAKLMEQHGDAKLTDLLPVL